MKLKLNLTLFLVFFLSLSSAQAGTISKPPYSLSLNSGLVGHWTFDGANITNGRINDISGQGNHGRLISIATSTFYVSGKLGQAFNFDATDDYIDTGSDLIGTSAGTYAAWIYARSDGENGIASIIDNRGLIFGIGYTSARTIGFSSNSGTTNAASANGAITYNTWNHVIVTRDASGVANIYVNGVLSGSANQNSGTPTAGTQNVDIGNTIFQSRTWDGYIDDVRVYNRVLTAAEITKLYSFGASKLGVTKTPTGLQSGLVGHWTFDGKDMSGGVARDISGQGNNGNPTNIATSTFYTVGKIGQGAKFDGVDDVVNMPNMDILESGNMSFSFWINLNGSQNLRWIMNQWNSSNQGPAIFIDSDGTLSFEIGSYGSGRIDTSATFPINTWTYVTATASGNVLTLYINGIQSVQATVVRTESSASQIFSLAGTHDSLVAISGLLDDVRIYSRALSTSEIAELYSAGTPKQNVTVSPTGLKSGLVGHWTFDGKDMSGGVARDISGQGNHGNTSGISTSTFYTVGKIGQGAKFDGVDDYITFASSPTPGSEMTVSTWVYKSADGILVYRGSSACCLSYHLKITSGKARFAIVTTSGSNPDIEIISNASIPDNTWTLVTATYSSSNSNLSLYINGTFDTSGSYTGTIYNSVVTMNIGARNTPSSFLTGTLDDVRIYSRALTASEILQLYSAGR